MDTIPVTVEPELAPANATVDWDRAGYVTCRLESPPPPHAGHVLRDVVDASFHIRRPRYLIIVDTLTITLDEHRRLVEMEMFTNPKQWKSGPNPPVGADAVSGFPVIDAPFDDDGRASEEAAPEIRYDPESRTLCLAWGMAQRWIHAASNVTLGLAEEGGFKQIRLAGLDVPEEDRIEDARKTGFWARLRRRLD